MMADIRKSSVIALFAAVYFVDVNTNGKVVDLSCNFDIDLCNWYQDENNDLNWTIAAQNYLFIGSDGRNVEQNAVLVSETQSPGNYCMTFWYRTYGYDARVLRVSLLYNENSEQTSLWSGTLSDVWLQVKLSIESQQYFKVKLSGKVSGYAGGYIMVDDVSFDNLWCAPDCDFDNGWCGWIHESGSNALEWQRSSSFPDHSSTNGHYARAYSYRSSDKAFVLVNPTVYSGTYCLSFWYRIYTVGGVLKIQIKSLSTGLSDNLLEGSQNVDASTWTHFQADVLFNESFQISFELTFNQRGFMHIDDLSLSCGECTSGLNQTECAFEHVVCGWTINQDWKRTTGDNAINNAAPTIDHTMRSKDGHYVYMEEKSSKAVMTSPTVLPGVYCFSFWYHMNGDGPRNLQLSMYESDFNQTENLFTICENQGDEWRPVYAQINSTNNFTLLFIGVRNGSSSGGIAVDDIHICPGQCKEVPATIDWYQPLSSFHVNVINLSEVGVIVTDTSAIIFEVKCDDDVRILLQDINNTTIEVAIGIQNNTQSAFVLRVENGGIAKHWESNIVTASSYRAFWISWDDGAVRVGKGFVPKAREFLRLNGSYDFMSFSVELSNHSDGYWKFYKDKFPRATTTSNPTSSVSHAVPSTQSSTVNVQTTSTKLSTASATTQSDLTSSSRTDHTTNATEKTEDNPLDAMPASGNGLVMAAAVAASCLVAVIVAIFVLIIWRKNYGARMTHCWNKNADRKVESTVAENYTYANTGTVLSAVNGQLQHSNDREYVNFGIDIQEGNTESSFIAKNIKSENDEEAYNHLQAIKHPDNTDAEYSHLQSSYQGYSGGNDKTYAHTNGITTNQSDPFLKNENDRTYNTVHLVGQSNKKDKGKKKQDEDATYDHATTKRNMEESCTENEYSHLERPTKTKNSNTFAEPGSEIQRGKTDNTYFNLEMQDDRSETEMKPDQNHENFILEKIER